jgi:hypothetical protein
MKPTAVVLYESSGVMREALRDVGFDAWSCDLQPADDGSKYHYQRDAYDLICAGVKFNVIIAHPTCTAMCVSGNHVYAEGKPRHHERIAAVRETERIWHMACTQAEHVVFENPTGVLPTMSSLPKPRYYQPYMFGDDASKNTALFFHNFEDIDVIPSQRCAGRTVTHNGKQVERWSNQTDSGQNRLGPSDDRWKIRSKTYAGLAAAIAKAALVSVQKRGQNAGA